MIKASARGTSWLLASFLLASGCMADEGEEALEEVDEALLPPLIGHGLPGGDVVVRWNKLAEQTFGSTGAPIASRSFAMVSVATHDAINAVRRRYETYAFHAWFPLASAEVAAAQAAHDVLVHLVPTAQATLDAELEVDLAAAHGLVPRVAGRLLGAAAAKAIIDKRKNDGSSATITYVQGTGPGDYQYTPGMTAILVPHYGNVTPFTYSNKAKFRPVPPPALDSAQWVEDFNEVKTYGDINSTTRTAEQTEYARFWREGTPYGWNRIARNVATDKDSDLWTTGRAFALLNLSVGDGFLSGWEAKQYYDFWRPITAIRAVPGSSNNDGNPETVEDAAWNSLNVSPPIQDYTSTHSIGGAAGAAALAAVWGDDTSFALTSPTSVPPNTIVRTYDSFSDAAWEGSDSRVAGGIHYRTACVLGLEQGYAIGEHVAARFLRPLR